MATHAVTRVVSDTDGDHYGIGTHRERRIALGVELEHTRPGLASVADIAIALDVLTAIITDHPGETGPFSVDGADVGLIRALVALEYEGAPLIVGGGDVGVRSWRVDGTPGPLSVDEPRRSGRYGAILGLMVSEYEGKPLIVAGGRVGVRSWRVEGTPGPLSVDDSDGAIFALVALEYEGEPLIVGGGDVGVRSWRVDEHAGAAERRRAPSFRTPPPGQLRRDRRVDGV